MSCQGFERCSVWIEELGTFGNIQETPDVTPSKINIAPQKEWLKSYCPFEMVNGPFSRDILIFGGVRCIYICILYVYFYTVYV